MCHTHRDIFHINAMGKPCPTPLLMLKRVIKTHPQIQHICLASSDPHSEIDIMRYCQIQQLKCTFNQHSDTHFEFTIER